MNIPITIQNKMRRAAKLYSEANQLMTEIDDFFESKGISDDIYRCGNGLSLEEIENGIDIVDDFVKWANLDFSEIP